VECAGYPLLFEMQWVMTRAVGGSLAAAPGMGGKRIECRVPVALLTATGDDARSLRLPGHQPEEQRKDHAVPGTPPLRRSRSRSYRTWLGPSKGYTEAFLGWRIRGREEEKMSMEVES